MQVSLYTYINKQSRHVPTDPLYSICVLIHTHRCTYSIQCSDKIRFLQLCIKCGVAKSCPGTYTALQAPILPSLYLLAALGYANSSKYLQISISIIRWCSEYALWNVGLRPTPNSYSSLTSLDFQNTHSTLTSWLSCKFYKSWILIFS